MMSSWQFLTQNHTKTWDTTKMPTTTPKTTKIPRPTHFLGEKHVLHRSGDPGPLLKDLQNTTSFSVLPSFHVVSCRRFQVEQRRGSPSVSVVSVCRKRPRSALRLTGSVNRTRKLHSQVNWTLFFEKLQSSVCAELRKKSKKLQFVVWLSRIFDKKCLLEKRSHTRLGSPKEERVWAFCLATHDLTAGLSSLKQNRIHDNYAGSKENGSTLIATKIGDWIRWYNGQQYCVYVLFPMHFNNWGTEFHLQWSSWMQSHLGIV